MMSFQSVERYKKLLAKEQKEGDEYVLIDAKWFEHWKRFVGITKPEDEREVTDPGPLDFTHLINPSTENHRDEVQLRSDAVEGNDYVFIPFELYKDLTEKHKQTGKEIVRKVIPSESSSHLTSIETFLVPLRLCESRNDYKTGKQIYRSRRTKLEVLKNDICKKFSITSTANSRLYTLTDDYGSTWEAIDDQTDLVLADIELTKNACITYESRTITTRNNTSLSSSRSSYVVGLCGLSNLGNTCFMNSALQCLSNVPALTEYFLRREYIQHINRDNPLGMKGDVAQAYGELIDNIWSGKNNHYAPKSLKQNVARYAPQFSGYAQQDSQEFMSFLLDGLHEDLNHVKQKPYVEKKDDDLTLEDHQLASEQWEYYRKRNQSKIHDIFHGQIKSVVQCLECKTLERSFYPICMLSLPSLNKTKIRTFKIEYVRLDGQTKCYHIKCNEHGRVRNLLQDFCNRFQPKQAKVDEPESMDTENGSASNENDDEGKEEEEEDFTKAKDYDGHQPRLDFILPVEVYNHRVHLQYRDDSILTSIMERDQIVFYEVPNSLKKGSNDTILMPCLFRVNDGYRHGFGLPIYLSIPRNNCNGADIQDALQKIIGNFLPLSVTDPSDKPLYTASCLYNYNYNQQTKSLSTMLTEHIDFGRTNTSLYVDVAPSVVDKYKEGEDKRAEKDRQSSNSSTNNGVQTRSQQKKQSTTSLLDCFRNFTTKEILSDENQWMCPTCESLTKASKKVNLWLLPKVLIVQLKRFNYTSYSRDIIDLLIDCPLRNLDLSQFVLNPAEKVNAKYDLIAVSNHMGGLGGGHYTAHAKNSQDRKWHSFDDSYVSDIGENDVISKAAYVLIYQQQEQQTQPMQQQSS